MTPERGPKRRETEDPSGRISGPDPLVLRKIFTVEFAKRGDNYSPKLYLASPLPT